MPLSRPRFGRTSGSRNALRREGLSPPTRRRVPEPRTTANSPKNSSNKKRVGAWSMAKSQTARSTIKNDPFATLIPDRSEEAASEEVTSNVVTPIRREQPKPEPGPAEGHKKEK